MTCMKSGTVAPTDRFRVRYLRINLSIVVGLFAAAVAAQWVSGSANSGAISFVANRFNHDVEVSIPTIYNYFLLVSNFGLLTLIYVTIRSNKESGARFWLILAVVFFLMGYDEAASVHERLIGPMASVLPQSPFLTFAWTPVGAAVALAAVAFSFWLRRYVAPEVVRLMVVAGAIYLSGALGFETLGGWIDFYHGRSSNYYFVAIIEESFEMLGMVVFGYGLLRQISLMQSRLHIDLT